MKRLSALVALAAAISPMAWAASLDLTISNVESADGQIRIAVFDSQEGWQGNAAVRTAVVDAEAGSVRITLDGLQPGMLGIKLYHDADDDGDLDTGNFGIPSEPYGFSNDAPVRLGPPAWKQARFTLGEGASAHSITLR